MTLDRRILFSIRRPRFHGTSCQASTDLFWEFVMDQLHKQVAQARRRLITEQFLVRLVWSLVAALAVTAVAVAIPRIIAIGSLPEKWDMGWLIGSTSAALL